MGSWRDNIRQVVPYTPGEQPKRTNLIKLNTNENPYPPSKKVQEMMEQITGWRLYPDPAASRLVHALADYHGLNDDNTLSRFSLLIIAIHITSIIILLQTFIFLKNYLKYTYNIFRELFIFSFLLSYFIKN